MSIYFFNNNQENLTRRRISSLVSLTTNLFTLVSLTTNILSLVSLSGPYREEYMLFVSFKIVRLDIFLSTNAFEQYTPTRSYLFHGNTLVHFKQHVTINNWEYRAFSIIYIYIYIYEHFFY
jgi:hypothetical protein